MDDILKDNYVDVCSYHFTLFALKKVNMVLMPYNYLINPIICKKVGIDKLIKDSLMIFDEGYTKPVVFI